jgi:hypothetical protein
MLKYFGIMKNIGSTFVAEPQSARSILRTLPAIARGFAFARDWHFGSPGQPIDSDKNTSETSENPLRDYFNGHKTGRGIWKWEHYFDVYHDHFRKYVGREVAVLEVGIYSGGSLDMWQTYFGAGCKVYGVDIEDACKVYEKDGVEVFIGDQADRSFWRTFKQQVPRVDILIDDGGHAPEQQIVTLEEMLPHLRPGGVYLCEDVQGIHHEFASYVSGLTSHLHSINEKPGKTLSALPTEFQRAVYSIHLYPFLVVIEKVEAPIDLFVCPNHGTEWQPFSVHSFENAQRHNE